MCGNIDQRSHQDPPISPHDIALRSSSQKSDVPYPCPHMDPVTHLLTGATLARTGFNRKAAYATLAMTLAAEAPDLDTLWSVRGPVYGLQHHRGITHTFLGIPFEAAIVLALVYALHRYRLHRAAQATRSTQRTQPATTRPLTAAPVRWPLLYAFLLVALLSHILLDWTNNYGIRPFFPFNPHWYALSIVFIVDPLILLSLTAALLAPALFGLVAGEVGARRTPFRGQGWAFAGLLAVLALWTLRFTQHAAALQLAATSSYGRPDAPVLPDQVLRTFASPSPLNPFLWHTIVETPAFFQFATADTRRTLLDTDPAADILPKPPVTPATLVADRSFLGHIYLDWSQWPVITDLGPTPLPSPNPAPLTSRTALPLSSRSAAEGSGSLRTTPNEVTFRDLRFFDSSSLTSTSRQNPPLSAREYIDLTQPPGSRILATYLDDRPQR